MYKCKTINGSEMISLDNVNDIRLMFKKVYSDYLSYLLIDETVVTWNSRHRLLPIKLQ